MKSVFGMSFTLAFLLLFVAIGGQGCKETKNVKVGVADKAQIPTLKEPEKKKETQEAVQLGVDSLSHQKIQEKRNEVIQEALTAIRETENAVTLLEKKDAKKALKALEKVTGKLEIILAREPNLAVAPVDVKIATHDVLMSLESIRQMRNQAEKLLKEGDVQDARRLISNLGSETVVSITGIPLASYPGAIKQVTQIIDKGNIDEAKVALADALSTLVVTDNIIPLPILRAEAMLEDAEQLAEKESRSLQANDSLTNLLENAQYQLQMAEALGYGDKHDYARFFSQIDTIKSKTEKGKSGKGFFNDIKNSLIDMKRRIFK